MNKKNQRFVSNVLVIIPHTVNIPDTWPTRLIERPGLIVVGSNNKRINADPFSIHGFVYINCPRAMYSKVP